MNSSLLHFVQMALYVARALKSKSNPRARRKGDQSELRIQIPSLKKGMPPVLLSHPSYPIKSLHSSTKASKT